MLNLCVSQFILLMVDVQRAQQFFGTFLVVNELSLRDSIRVQDTVSEMWRNIQKP